MHFRTTRAGVASAAVLTLAACTRADDAASERASADLACPARDLTVTCAGGKVFHLHEQFRCAARGCGRSADYACEAPLNQYGPFELLGDATCR